MEGEGKFEAAARRQFLFDAAKIACGVGMLGLGLGLYTKHARALPPTALRPPGARPEPQFLGACIRCGMCVRDCPYDILDLAKLEQDTPTGTPYFVARSGPCEMCEDIPCIKACPTGTIASAGSGFRVLLGGKLGRHPALFAGSNLAHDRQVEPARRRRV